MRVPDDEPGGVVQCAGCGKRVRYGEPAATGGQDDLNFDIDAGAALAAGAIRKASGPPRNWRTTLVAALAGAMATAMLVVLGVVAHHVISPVEPAAVPTVAPWDRAHRADLLALKAEAESLAIAGKWQQSYDSYQRILSLVGDHEVKDPVALAVIEAVRPGEERAMSQMVVGPLVPPAPAPIIEAKPATLPVEPAPAQRAVVPAPSATTQAATAPVGGQNVAREAATTQAATTAPVTSLDAAQITADTAPPLAGPPPPPVVLHAYSLPDAVTDQQIGEAINKGVKFLAGQFVGGEVKTGLNDALRRVGEAGRNRGDRNVPSNLDNASDLGNLPPPTAAIPPPPNFTAPWESAYSTPGIDALAVYALLNAGRAMDVPGLAVNDPFTEQILDQLKHYDMVFTYHRSLRAAALAVFNRTQDNAALEDDVRWLLAASMQGGYTYTIPPNGFDAGMYDNSNSQYGLLGVWSGAQAGKAISQQYWQDVERHWNSCAIGNGTWGYSTNTAASTTMTCAGIASLLVAREYLDSSDMGGALADRPSPSPTLDAGLTWLDTGDNCLTNLAGDGMGGAGYGLYGLERVGLASGFKYFGKHDWYSEFAKRLVNEQHFDGSWGGATTNKTRVQAQTVIDTSYALLFLARGRHPILFNKLRYPGPWNNRPHDAAHLARFAANQLERPLNWQVVNLRRNWFDWMDCPVLYIAGDKRLKLTPQDYLALRDFANGGGTIFTHADGGSAEFNKWVADMVRQIFPKYELMLVPRDSSMYSTVYPIKNPPPLLSVSNGSRMLLIHSPTDLAGGWQLNWTDERKLAFQLGTNLFVYAAGKGNLKNRLASSYIPQDPDRPDSSRQIARLQYAGEWDPEPYAWARFARYFQWETHQAIEPVVVPMKALTPDSQPLAVLTGTVRQDFSDAEAAAVRAYVQSGGILLIDACGGQKDFVKSVETTLLPKAFAGATPTPIAPNHPLLIASRAHADDLTHALLRSYAIENGGKNLPIETIACGKGWVIFSPLDLSTGLLGTQSWGIMGFDPAYSQALMKNAVLWAEARSPLSNPSSPEQK